MGTIRQWKIKLNFARTATFRQEEVVVVERFKEASMNGLSAKKRRGGR